MTTASPHTSPRQLLGRIGIFCGVAACFALAAVCGLWFWGGEGTPTVPVLEERWWSGSYKSRDADVPAWYLARFMRLNDGRLRMAIVFGGGRPIFFDVERDTSAGDVVHLTMRERSVDHPARIEATQLYQGKRYYWDRLFAGRLQDFWRPNENIAIRGVIIAPPAQTDFEIAPLQESELAAFWQNSLGQQDSPPDPVVLDILGTGSSDAYRRSE